MDFGWAGRAFWAIAVIIILGAIWYPKRKR